MLVDILNNNVLHNYKVSVYHARVFSVPYFLCYVPRRWLIRPIYWNGRGLDWVKKLWSRYLISNIVAQLTLSLLNYDL